MRNITIFDTTLRDGEQSPGASMNLSEKLEVAQALVDLKVDVIEAGFPIASPGDFEAVQAIAGQVRGVQVCGLARCNDKDIDRAGDALRGAE
ncbi:MAG: 2-isopropylmalate synthase, partial [Planctomycetota bacterium]